MRFWDTSAITPLLLDDPDSPLCEDALRVDPGVVIFASTKVEMFSALSTRLRAGRITEERFTKAIGQATERFSRWRRIDAWAAVLSRAEDLILRYPLRAADAIQLGAALVFAGGFPQGTMFVSRDDELCKAAGRERFIIIRPTYGPRPRGGRGAPTPPPP